MLGKLNPNWIVCKKAVIKTNKAIEDTMKKKINEIGKADKADKNHGK